MGFMNEASEETEDTALAAAIDWVIRIRAAPDDAALRARLAAWLDGSPARHRAYAKAERAWRLTGEVPPAHAVRRPAPRRRLALAGAALAAGIAAVALPSLRLALSADYATGTAETRRVVLADGSVATLAADSALAIDHSSGRRGVTLLRGEAFFQIVHDPAHPFSIDAAGVTIRDIGTAFDVEIERSRVLVVVQSGSVAVSRGGDGGAGDETLAPGDRLCIDRQTGRVTRGTAPVDAVADWRNGRIVVQDVPTRQVIEQLRRYSPGLIWVRDTGLLDRRISGVFDLSDPLSALRAVVEPHAGTVAEITPYLWIVSAR